MRRSLAALWSVSLGALAITPGAAGQPAPGVPRYAAAVEEALLQLDLDVRCANEGAQRQHCRGWGLGPPRDLGACAQKASKRNVRKPRIAG